jgi:hypothetical protein
MKCSHKFFYGLVGFFIGNFFLAGLLFVFSATNNMVSMDVSVRRAEQREMNPPDVRQYQTNLVKPEDSDLLLRFFQILFWLFFVSPPVIVVLLLVIIRKMDEKKSLE